MRSYFHIAHSFVRGNWRRSDTASPLIMQKSCHDMDLLVWLVGSGCRQVASFGGLTYFKPENAPAGAAACCADCPHKDTCRFSAYKAYLPVMGNWPAAALTEDQTEEGLREAIRTGPYGRCVFHCDNTVCDHQVTVLCIPYSAKNPEGVLKFLAWLWGNQDNYLFCLYGEKGKDWDLDENGRLITLSETARGDGYFYEWMFRNANYQVFGAGVTDEYIETYKHWDDVAIPSAMLGFAFDNTGFEAIETACTEAFKKLTPILYGYVDFDTEYPKAIAELEAAGINEYVAEVNRQLAEFMGK